MSGNHSKENILLSNDLNLYLSLYYSRGFLHDPDVYPDPMKFDPTRFIGEDSQLDPRNIVFGFGRRSVCALLLIEKKIVHTLIFFIARTCPGRYFAEETLFLSIATTLSVFDITAVQGYMPKYEYDDGFIRYVTSKRRWWHSEVRALQSPQALQMQHHPSFITSRMPNSFDTPGPLNARSLRSGAILFQFYYYKGA